MNIAMEMFIRDLGQATDQELNDLEQRIRQELFKRERQVVVKEDSVPQEVIDELEKLWNDSQVSITVKFPVEVDVIVDFYGEDTLSLATPTPSEFQSDFYIEDVMDGEALMKMPECQEAWDRAKSTQETLEKRISEVAQQYDVDEDSIRDMVW